MKILGFRQTRNRQREQPADKQKDSVTDRLINRQTDKKTDRQAGRPEVCGLVVEAEGGRGVLASCGWL